MYFIVAMIRSQLPIIRFDETKKLGLSIDVQGGKV